MQRLFDHDVPTPQRQDPRPKRQRRVEDDLAFGLPQSIWAFLLAGGADPLALANVLRDGLSAAERRRAYLDLVRDLGEVAAERMWRDAFGLARAGLPDEARRVAEAALGEGLGHVELVRGAPVDALTARLGTAAFTIGRQVFVRGDESSTPVLVHEAVHVAQQKGQNGVQVAAPSAAAEREAHSILGRLGPLSSRPSLVAERAQAQLAVSAALGRAPRVTTRPMALAAYEATHQSVDDVLKEAQRLADALVVLVGSGASRHDLERVLGPKDDAYQSRVRSTALHALSGRRLGDGRDAGKAVATILSGESGKPLPAALKSELESRLGASFDDVRVHDDPDAAAAAARLSANAFTQGRDIYFAAGKYDPSSPEGKRLVTHELVHVAQQRGAPSAQSSSTSSINFGTAAEEGTRGAPISQPGSAIEREAERVAHAVEGGARAGEEALAISERAPSGTISRDSSPAGGAPAGAPSKWIPLVMSRALDLSTQLPNARDRGDGTKEIDVNQALGPIRITTATFHAEGDKVDRGTLLAAVDTGPFHGTTGTLTVDGQNGVSGTLTVPINVPGAVVKQVQVTVGPNGFSGTATLDPHDLVSPHFPVKMSNIVVTAASTESGGVDVRATGSAKVSVENGMATGEAEMTAELHAGPGGVTFKATLVGKLDIAGIASVGATIEFDGQKITITAGADVPINLPGLEGIGHVSFAGGKLSLAGENVHFTLPSLSKVQFDEVRVEERKLKATLALGGPVEVPLPGGAKLTLTNSTVTIDGKSVNGSVTGQFAVGPGAGALSGEATIGYEEGHLNGSVTIGGGADATVAGVQVSVNAGSKLTIVGGTGISGHVSGKVKIPGVPDIDVAVVAEVGQPIDITCDTHLQLSQLSSTLGGDLHVVYHRGGGANSFSFDAANVAVNAGQLKGQVLFESLSGHLQGKEVTGSLTARAGTQIKAGGTTVTVDGGTVNLLPGKILDGHLQAHAESGASHAKASVGWNHGKFDWSAEGDFDLAQVTGGKLIGTVHAAAGSNGVGNFESTGGPIKFGVPALANVEIKHLSGNKETNTYSATVDFTAAANELTKDLRDLHIRLNTATATVGYDNGHFHLNGVVDGNASYAPQNVEKLAGHFNLSLDDSGFSGTLADVKITASDYFKSEGGSADLKTGQVSLGQATFEVPGVCKGDVTTADVNVKSGQFKLAASVDVTVPSLAGLKIDVSADNAGVTGTLAKDAPPIKLGDFATLTIGQNSSVGFNKAEGMHADINGALAAPSVGNGEFHFTYAKRELTGTAKLHVNPIGIFDQTDLELTLQGGKVSTLQPVRVQLAPQHQNTLEGYVDVSVTQNKFDVTGTVTKLKNLGKVSDAFQGATVHYANHDITMHADVDLGGVIPQLAKGSLLSFDYANRAVTLKGTLKPGQLSSAVTFTDDTHISAEWSSATPREFKVTGEAHADIANLATADFTIDMSKSAGTPGQFGLKGHIDATKLGQKLGKGVVQFSSVTADINLLVGGGGPTQLDFAVDAGITKIASFDCDASIHGEYHNGQGVSGELAVRQIKLGDVVADGNVQIEHNHFKSGSLHIVANFPSVKIEGTGQVTAGELGQLSTSATLTVTPGGNSALSKFIQSGSIAVVIERWQLQSAVGKLTLVPPSFLPIENPTVEIGYVKGEGLHATLTTQFNAPFAKNGEKGTFVAGYSQAQGLYAHIEFPITVPGFKQATVRGDLNQHGVVVGADLVPNNNAVIKSATVNIGYGDGGFFFEGKVKVAPSETMELEIGVRFSQAKGFEVIGITQKENDQDSGDHEVANWHKDFPTIPLLTVGVASLGLKFGFGVAAGYRMPKVKMENPTLEGGLEALDSGGLPPINFGGKVAMGAYLALSFSIEIAGEIQLLIATASAGIGAEITARLNLELGADVKGRFEQGKGANLKIDPFVGASLDLIAALIATLHAEICWFTIVDKKWTLASATFAHIDLGQFRPFQPVEMQLGGPGGTHLVNGLHLRDDALEQITTGVKEGGKKTADENANKDAHDKLQPVLRSFKEQAHQFEELPPGWENGMTVAPVDFDSMFHIDKKAWDLYREHADDAEKIVPEEACTTPTQKLSKAVAIMSKWNPYMAGQLILSWRRAQIAAKGIDPDNGVNVVEERQEVQALIQAKYEADLAEAQRKQKEQDEEHARHVKKQHEDHHKAEHEHEKKTHQQKLEHEHKVKHHQQEGLKAQKDVEEKAKLAQKEGALEKPSEQDKAPPPPLPPEPPLPAPLAKPEPIPVPPPVPLPPPPVVLPAVTLPALPSDPGVSATASGPIAPQEKKVPIEKPGVAAPPTGGAPNPQPGATSGQAKQVGGKGGGAMPGSGAPPSAGPSGGGGGGTATPPGPAVQAGPQGIISQAKTLDAKKAQYGGGKGAAGGKAGAGAAAGAAPPSAPAAGGAAPAGAAPAGAPGKDKNAGAKKGDAAGGALDPTVQKVADKGKADEEKQKQALAQKEKEYHQKIDQKKKGADSASKKLDDAAAAAHKRHEMPPPGAILPGTVEQARVAFSNFVKLKREGDNFSGFKEKLGQKKFYNFEIKAWGDVVGELQKVHDALRPEDSMPDVKEWGPHLYGGNTYQGKAYKPAAGFDAGLSLSDEQIKALEVFDKFKTNNKGHKPGQYLIAEVEKMNDAERTAFVMSTLQPLASGAEVVKALRAALDRLGPHLPVQQRIAAIDAGGVVPAPTFWTAMTSGFNPGTAGIAQINQVVAQLAPKGAPAAAPKAGPAPAAGSAPATGPAPAGPQPGAAPPAVAKGPTPPATPSPAQKAAGATANQPPGKEAPATKPPAPVEMMHWAQAHAQFEAIATKPFESLLDQLGIHPGGDVAGNKAAMLQARKEQLRKIVAANPSIALPELISKWRQQQRDTVELARTQMQIVITDFRQALTAARKTAPRLDADGVSHAVALMRHKIGSMSQPAMFVPGLNPSGITPEEQVSGEALLAPGEDWNPLFDNAFIQVTYLTVDPSTLAPPKSTTQAPPAATGTQPPATGTHPPATGTQPPATGTQPAATGTQPAATGTQPMPATGTQSPPTGKAGPTGTQPLPATGTQSPPTGKPGPTGTQPMPAVPPQNAAPTTGAGPAGTKTPPVTAQPGAPAPKPPQPPAPAPPPWEAFKQACAAHDAAKVQATIAALTPADLVKAKAEPQVMQQMLQTLHSPAGVQKLKAPFGYDFQAGFDPIMKAFPGATMKDPLEAWMAANNKDGVATLGVVKVIPGVDKSFIDDVVKKLDAAAELAVINDTALCAWLHTTYFATQYPTDVFPKVKAWVASYKADAALATWLGSNESKLNALIAAGTDKVQWVGALIAKPDLLTRLLPGPGWKQLLLDFSTQAPGDHAALKANETLLGAVLAIIGNADAPTFLKNLHCTLVEGAKALRASPAAAVKAYFNDAQFSAAAQAAACRDASFQAVLAQRFAAEFISDVLQKLTVASAELPALYQDVQAIFDWINAGANKAKFETLIKAPTPNLADWIAPLIRRQQHSFILLAAAANSQPWIAAVTGQKFTDLISAAPLGAALPEDQARGVKALTNSAATLAELQLITKKLYSITVHQAAGKTPFMRGPNVTQNGVTWEMQYQYTVVTPSVMAYKTMLQQFAELPRSHVNTQKTVVLGDGTYDWWSRQVNPPPAQAWQGPTVENMGTSFWDPGTSVVVLDAAGAGNSAGTIPMGPGNTASAVGASPTPAKPVALTYFQNHATHEAGHAVGARTLHAPNRPPLSGDQMAMTWSNWQEGRSAQEFIGAMWNNSQSQPPNPGQPKIKPEEAKAFLMAELGSPGSGVVPTTFATLPAFRAELSHQHGQQRLYKYEDDTRRSGNKYTFPNVQPGSNVYLMAGPGKFTSYDRMVFDNKQDMSWYALSSYKEMFAEMYTRHFAQRGALPPANRGVDPTSFMNDLERATDADFSAQQAPEAVPNKVGLVDQMKRWLRPWRKAAGAATNPRTQIPEGGGTALAATVRGKMEKALNADLAGVRVHTSGESAQAAADLGARAFTVGSDVHFASGEFAPGSKEGDRLLAHELAHVVQGQKGAVQRKADESATGHDVSQPHEPAEQEADASADRVVEHLHGDKAAGEHGEAAGEHGEAAGEHGEAAGDHGKKDGVESKAGHEPAREQADPQGGGHKVHLKRKTPVSAPAPSPAPARGEAAEQEAENESHPATVGRKVLRKPNPPAPKAPKAEDAPPASGKAAAGAADIKAECAKQGGAAAEIVAQLEHEVQIAPEKKKELFTAASELFQKKSGNPLDAIQATLKNHSESYLCKGRDITLEAVRKEGGINRVVDLPSVFRYYLQDDIKDGKFQSQQDRFLDGAATGQFDPYAQMKEDALLQGWAPLTWWSAGPPLPGGADMGKIMKSIHVDNASYKDGGVRLDLTPDDFAKAMVEHGLRIYKPTAFDGAFQVSAGGDKALFNQDKDGSQTWGITKGGAKEAVMKPMQIKVFKRRTLLAPPRPTHAGAAAGAPAKAPPKGRAS